MDAINLDCMDEDELAGVARDHAVKEIRAYATIKLQAMWSRQGGGCIDAALRHEATCDRIYDQLPASLRW